MKKILWLLISVFLISCSSSNDVVYKGPIAKRKYRSGWTVDFVQNKKKDQKSSAAIVSKELSIESELHQVEANTEVETSYTHTNSKANIESNVNEGPHVIVEKNANPISRAKGIKEKASGFLNEKLEKAIEKRIPNDGIEKDKAGGDNDNFSYITLGGIASMFFSLGWIPFLNVIIALAFLVTGILALLKGENRALAILAFISSIIFLVLTIAWSAVFVFAFTL